MRMKRRSSYNILIIRTCTSIKATYLALRWPVVGGFMGWAIWGKRWIGLLRGRGGWNQHCPEMAQPFPVCWGRARV